MTDSRIVLEGQTENSHKNWWDMSENVSQVLIRVRNPVFFQPKPGRVVATFSHGSVTLLENTRLVLR